MTSLTTIAQQTLQGIGFVFGVRYGTEEGRYRLEDQTGGVEIRSYPARIAAETVVLADDDAARNIGFRRLAGYIFGANRAKSKIAMTAPVAQRSATETNGTVVAMTTPVAQARSETGQSVIRFFMPAAWTMDTLPEPGDPNITLVDVPAETFAVLRFTGNRSPAEVRRRTDQLLRAVTRTDYQAAGTPVAWFYDPPITLPFRRRNEVAVPVTIGAP